MEWIDISRGIRDIKISHEMPVSGKDKVRKSPLASAGKYLTGNRIMFL